MTSPARSSVPAMKMATRFANVGSPRSIDMSLVSLPFYQRMNCRRSSCRGHSKSTWLVVWLPSPHGHVEESVMFMLKRKFRSSILPILSCTSVNSSLRVSLLYFKRVFSVSIG